MKSLLVVTDHPIFGAELKEALEPRQRAPEVESMITAMPPQISQSREGVMNN